MSVLIRGMEMPESCKTCELKSTIDDYPDWFCNVTGECVEDFCDMKVRPNFCPLVEVKTPHGRLVDIDKVEWFQVKGDVTVGDDGIGKRTFALLPVSHINELPTVIESED